MSDVLGLLFPVLLIVGAFVGLKVLSKPQTRTEAEFERNAAESTSMLGAGMNALQEALDPAAVRAKEVQTQMKEGRYGKKKREGKANGADNSERFNITHFLRKKSRLRTIYRQENSLFEKQRGILI